MNGARFNRSARRQRGAALLTAMIIVTLVATLAASMVWQQWRAVQVEVAERSRAQSAWILHGGMELAKLILSEDQKTSNGRQFTALTEPWAVPLKEGRVSTLLGGDNTSADDDPEAFLSGSIEDAQARYNLRNLIGVDGNQKPTKSAPDIVILRSLCQSAGLDTGVADRIADGLLQTQVTPGTATAAAPLNPNRVTQLTWLSIDEAAARALERYVVLLPQTSNPILVNVNTASAEVLVALTGLDSGTIDRVVKARQTQPFKTAADFLNAIGNPKSPPLVAVHSDYFEVRARARLVDHVLVERTLLRRGTQPGQFEVLDHERIAGLEQTGN